MKVYLVHIPNFSLPYLLVAANSSDQARSWVHKVMPYFAQSEITDITEIPHISSDYTLPTIILSL